MILIHNRAIKIHPINITKFLKSHVSDDLMLNPVLSSTYLIYLILFLLYVILFKTNTFPPLDFGLGGLCFLFFGISILKTKEKQAEFFLDK